MDHNLFLLSDGGYISSLLGMTREGGGAEKGKKVPVVTGAAMFFSYDVFPVVLKAGEGKRGEITLP